MATTVETAELAPEGVPTQIVLGAGDHAYVLSQGRIVYDGSPRPLIEHPDILQRACLGEVQ